MNVVRRRVNRNSLSAVSTFSTELLAVLCGSTACCPSGFLFLHQAGHRQRATGGRAHRHRLNLDDDACHRSVYAEPVHASDSGRSQPQRGRWCIDPFPPPRRYAAAAAYSPLFPSDAYASCTMLTASRPFCAYSPTIATAQSLIVMPVLMRRSWQCARSSDTAAK